MWKHISHGHDSSEIYSQCAVHSKHNTKGLLCRGLDINIKQMPQSTLSQQQERCSGTNSDAV